MTAFENLLQPAAVTTNQQSKTPFFAPAVGPNALSRQETPKAKTPASGLKDGGSVIDFRYYASAQSLIDIRKQIAALCSRRLSQTMVKPDSPINKDTAALLDEVIERAATCDQLIAYIDLKGKKVATGHYQIYQHNKWNDNSNDLGASTTAGQNYPDKWHQAAATYLRKTDDEFKGASLGQRKAKILKIGGFYDRSNDTINLPSDATFGSALHEAVHRLSQIMFRNLYGTELNEGVTQFFTDLILHNERLGPATGHKYGANLALAQRLVNKTGGIDLLARLYFQGSLDAHKQIMVILGFYRTVNGPYRPVSWAEISAAIRR